MGIRNCAFCIFGELAARAHGLHILRLQPCWANRVSAVSSRPMLFGLPLGLVATQARGRHRPPNSSTIHGYVPVRIVRFGRSVMNV